MNIVLSGGGMKCLTYLGALEELEKYIHKKWINKIIGVSGGCLVGFLYSLGMSIEEILTCIEEGLEKHGSIGEDSLEKCLFQYAYDDGQKLKSWIEDCLIKLNLPKDLLLEDYPKNSIPFVIIAFNLSTSTLEYWDTSNPPKDLDLVTAIIASCSIPLVFKPVIWKDMYFVDGGVVFDVPKYKDTLIFTLFKDTHDFDKTTWDPFSWYSDSIDSMQKFQMTTCLKHSKYKQMWINIPTPKEVGIVDTELTKQQKTNILNVGKSNMKKYIKQNGIIFSNKFTFY